MSNSGPVVFVVDDDPSVREGLENLVRSAGHRVQSFGSASSFLAFNRPDLPSCLVLDMCMPGLSGLELQDQLAKAGAPIPTIFITGHGDIPMTVRAMKAGAVEFLTKPFRNQDLLSAIQHCLAKDREARAACDAKPALQCADSARAPGHGAHRNRAGKRKAIPVEQAA